MTEGQPPRWDDPTWREKSDTAWRARLRRHQAWWREEVAGMPPGPRAGGDRLVSSMLPVGVDLRPNLLTDAAVAAAEHAIAMLRQQKRPGLIEEERLRRNLLSSQPLCVNLFGHLSSDADSLLPWVKSLDPEAEAVANVDIEWAPADGTLGGSAMDACVEYSLPGDRRGLIAVECKYAENLADAHPRPAPEKYIQATESDPRWKPGAASALDATALRQFWYNQLLTHVAADAGNHARAMGVVVALRSDEAARAATEAVAAQLVDGSTMRFAPIEDFLQLVEGHDDWKEEFTKRYVDLSLSAGGTRTITQEAVVAAADKARLLLERVGGPGGVLEQIERGQRVSNGDPELLDVLADVGEQARQARIAIDRLTR